MEAFFRRFTARYTISWLGFFGTLTVYFCRLNLSISIVSMVKQVEASSSSSSNSTLCPQSSDYFVQNISLDGEILDKNSSNGEFDWNIGAQGGLLASYYYGYIWTQAVGPQLATKVGYKRVWLYAMLFASLLTFLGKYMLYCFSTYTH